jgi:hypothetical protein
MYSYVPVLNTISYKEHSRDSRQIPYGCSGIHNQSVELLGTPGTKLLYYNVNELV